MTEKEFLKEGDVTVTNSRFIVPGQTYAMSGITSVKSVKKNPSKALPIILIVLGIIFLAADVPLVGIILIGLGIAILILNKPQYIVILSSASGETEALTSKNKEFITRVINALNDAIVARG